MIHIDLKVYTTTFIVASLFMLSFGCTSVPPKTQYQASITKLAIVAANHPPEIKFEGFSRSKGKGAIDTMGKALDGSLQGRELGIILLPITLPVSAAIGAAMAPSADTVKHAEEEWSKDFEKWTTMDFLHDQVIAAARDNGASWQPVTPDLRQHILQTADYKALANSGIDTVLELAITRISARGDALDAPLSLQMYAHARLLRTEDNTEIFSADGEYWGDRHTRSEWTADNSKILLHALAEGYQALGKHIYENVFMLYPFPDQKWHSYFPRGALGLAPIDPPLGFSVSQVKDLRPTLRWQGFPRGGDVKNAPEDMGRVKNVSYDLYVAERHGYDLKIIYRRERIPNPEHTLEKSLQSGTVYSWSVRARFDLDGRERVTEWSGLALGMFPEFDRRFVPPFGDFYIFETP